MIRHYLKAAFRNLLGNKFYTTINIAGLSIGIAVSIMILSFVWFERSFDRFHSKSDQIYRIIQTKRVFEEEEITGLTHFGLVPALKEDFPEIIQAGRLFHVYWPGVEMSNDTGEFVKNMNELIVADPEIFDIFDIQFIHGDPATVFEDPNSIILTEEESQLFFGKDNPIGEFITIPTQEGEDDIRLKVTGVVKSMPKNSHFHFKHLIPQKRFPMGDNSSFVGGWYTSYVVLPKDFNPDILTKKLPDFVIKHYTAGIEEWVKISYDEWIKTGGYWKLSLQPLKQIHLGEYSFWEPYYIYENQGNLFRVQIYTFMALLIIFLASINYIILAIAKSGIRAKEVGVHKVIGATRKQLIYQFLVESIVLSSIAFLVAIIMIQLFAESFYGLLEIQTFYRYAEIVFILITFFGFTLVIGVLAGSYPAFFLSAFRPIQALRGPLFEKVKGMKVRNSLVVFQFIITVILIISSITVYKQFVYMQNKDLGFEKENIIILRNLIGNLYFSKGHELSFTESELRMRSFRQEVLKHPSVTNASYVAPYPGKWGDGGYIQKTVKIKGEESETTHVVHMGRIDDAFLDVFGVGISKGKNFSKDQALSTTREGIIINNSAAKQFGLKEPVGKFIYTDVWNTIKDDKGEEREENSEESLQIIGVFEDFHNRNLHEDIKPTIYFPLNKGGYYTQMLAIKFLPGQMPDNLDFLANTWNDFTEVPIEYFFFEKEFDDLYMKEKKLAQAFIFFTILAIFIACLGMFGLVLLATEQRTKEIGIRKVNGATIREILNMLNKDFIKWVAIAYVIACPIAYYSMNNWLENFAFKTALSWWVFTLAGMLILIVALLTVSWRSWKAATSNPVEALRNE
ncbi:MAG: ABC transporter permease [Maribacter sp.]|nr:ABC transporter permease [Maribacter sp.]